MAHDQLALRANAEEHLQQQRAEQLFRWHRGAPFARIKATRARVQLRQDIPHQPPHLAQRMIRRDPRLRREVGEQSTLVTEPARHRLPPQPSSALNHCARRPDKGFQRTADDHAARCMRDSTLIRPVDERTTLALSSLARQLAIQTPPVSICVRRTLPLAIRVRDRWNSDCGRSYRVALPPLWPVFCTGLEHSTGDRPDEAERSQSDQRQDHCRAKARSLPCKTARRRATCRSTSGMAS